MKSNHKRKKYYHSTGAQGRYILSYFLIAAVFTLIFTLVFVFFVYDSLSITYDNYNLRVGRTPAIFFERFLKTYGLLIFFGGFAILFIATRITHKTAGPVYKIEKTLDEMIKGEIDKKIVLRKHDNHKSIAGRINRLSAMLSTHMREMNTVLEEAEEMYESEKTKSDPDHPSLEYVELTKIKAAHEKLKGIVSTFKLSD